MAGGSCDHEMMDITTTSDVTRQYCCRWCGMKEMGEMLPGAPYVMACATTGDLARAGRTEILEVRGDVKRALREVDL